MIAAVIAAVIAGFAASVPLSACIVEVAKIALADDTADALSFIPVVSDADIEGAAEGSARTVTPVVNPADTDADAVADAFSFPARLASAGTIRMCWP